VDFALSVVWLCSRRSTSWSSPLSLHDALPIFAIRAAACVALRAPRLLLERRAGLTVLVATERLLGEGAGFAVLLELAVAGALHRSEEHTSELQSRENLVCRLLLEKKNQRADYS